MNMNSGMAPLQSLCCLMLLLATSLVGSAAPPSGIRLELTHVDSKGNFTKSELLRRAAHRSRLRAAMLSAAASHGTCSPTWDARPKMHWSGSEYIVELAIGTPPVPFAGLADTGSDLIWTQSRPCARCAHQSTPIYDPSASRSFSLEPCSSAMCRGTPRFHLDHNCSSSSSNTRPPQRCHYSFGYADGAYSKGVLGRERGPRPRPTVPVELNISPLLSLPQPKATPATETDAPGLPPSNDTSLSPPCYSLEAGGADELPDMPDMVLHFAGGADMRLHRDAVLYRWGESAMCLGFEGSRDKSTVIGNFQQQNLHVLYDICAGRL